jgi:hypothetical protein
MLTGKFIIYPVSRIMRIVEASAEQEGQEFERSCI